MLTSLSSSSITRAGSAFGRLGPGPAPGRGRRSLLELPELGLELAEPCRRGQVGLQLLVGPLEVVELAAEPGELLVPLVELGPGLLQAFLERPHVPGARLSLGDREEP